MRHPKCSAQIKGTKLTPLEGLSNSVSIIIKIKCDEILENPTTGSQAVTNSIRLSSYEMPIINLSSTSHNHIQQLLCTQLRLFSDNRSIRKTLARGISKSAIDFGFGSNGFVLNVSFTITYYRHTVAFKILKTLFPGRIKEEELERLKTETEPCSICLDDLFGSYRNVVDLHAWPVLISSMGVVSWSGLTAKTHAHCVGPR